MSKTTLKSMLQDLRKSVTAQEIQSVNIAGKLDKIIKVFIPFNGSDSDEFGRKKKSLFLKENIYIRCKNGDKLNRAGALTLSKSEAVVVSKVRKFIITGNEIKDDTTYGQILKATAKKPVVRTDKRKGFDKRYNNLPDSMVVKMFKLLDDMIKAENNANKIVNAKKVKKVANK